MSVWQEWLEGAAKLTQRHMRHDWDDENEPINPFSYNECASVSLLASAACYVGFSSLAEYVTIKSARDRRFKDRNGRCDLWLADRQDRHWEFEFKQPFARFFQLSTLEDMMHDSRIEADTLLTRRTKLRDRGVIPVAGRVLYSGPLKDRLAFEQRLIDFCKAGDFEDLRRTWVRHAWKLQTRLSDAPTFFLFDIMKKD